MGASAAGVDLHRLWDDRCAGCHGHAGDFAREHLRVRAGVLEGRHHERDLRVFLRHHYPADADVEDIYAMLLAQAGTETRFRSRCGGCHERAVTLVRAHVVRENGTLVGRASGRALESFLPGHGGLPAAEASFFVDLLERIDGEVHRRAAPRE